LVELIYTLFLGLIALGLGRFLLRIMGVSRFSMAEELAFGLGLGLGAMALGVMALGLAHLLYAELFYLLLLAAGFVGAKELLGLRGRLSGRIWGGGRRLEAFYYAVGLGTAVLVLFSMVRALTPAVGAVDPLAYHLALPKIFLLKHYLSFEPTITGALYPSNIGMLYALGIGLRGEILAQMIHWMMGVGTLFAVLAFCRRYFDLRTGIWAAAIFMSMPVLAFFMPLGYIDVGLCFFQFLALWGFFIWLEEKDEKVLLLAAVLTGLALGAKHPALPMWVVCMVMIGVDAYRRRLAPPQAARLWAIFGAVSLGLLLPWYLRSWLASGNPVWPLANEYFQGFPYRGTFNVGSGASSGGGADWVPSLERLQALVKGCAVALWSWTWNTGDWQRSIGPHFLAFLPALAMVARRRALLLLAAFCGGYYLIAVVYVDGNPRYSLFLFAFLSVVAGCAAQRLCASPLHWIRHLLQLGFCISLAVNGVVAYALAESSLRFLFSANSREQFLLENEANARVYRQVNTTLPASAKILIQGDVKGYYCDREYLWDHPYQMVINYRQYDTPEKLIARMRELGITHVVRMIYIPPVRTQGVGYPQYFADPFHEDFRKQYLRLLYKDDSFVLFEVIYSSPPGAVP